MDDDEQLPEFDLGMGSERDTEESWSDVEVEDVVEEVVAEDGEVADVRPVGYDTEFWGPFINDEYGGSDAVEVMCSLRDVGDERLNKMKEVLCSSNDAFDHTVIVNGESSGIAWEGYKQEMSDGVDGNAWLKKDGQRSVEGGDSRGDSMSMCGVVGFWWTT